VEVAQLRVENLEARVLLQKAEVLEELRPSHELLTDKEQLERLQHQLLEARQGPKRSAGAAAVEHRVVVEAMRGEIQELEVLTESLATGPAAATSQEAEEKARALTEAEDRLMYEQSTSAFHASEQGRSALALQRAGAEMRVLTSVITSLDEELAALALATSSPPEMASSANTGGTRGKAVAAAAPTGRAGGRPPLAARRSGGPTRGRT